MRVFLISQLGETLKERPDLVGGMHFSYPPVGVRLEVSMMEDWAVDASAGRPRHSHRELLC